MGDSGLDSKCSNFLTYQFMNQQKLNLTFFIKLEFTERYLNVELRKLST